MATTVQALNPDAGAGAGAGAAAPTNVPMRKRKKADDGDDETDYVTTPSTTTPPTTAAAPTTTGEPNAKKQKIDTTPESNTVAPASTENIHNSIATASDQGAVQDTKGPVMTKAREIRLEQNRKAARESRRRKKVMIEELQRSVIFFSRANGTLKQQNEELSRLLMQAQAQVAAIECQQTQNTAAPASSLPPPDGKVPAHDTTTQNNVQNPPQTQQAPAPQAQGNFHQSQAQTVATQAMLETQGFPSAAARAAAQTMNAGVEMNNDNNNNNNNSSDKPAAVSTPAPPATTTTSAAPAPTSTTDHTLPSQMQPGSSMQAMANFQQAASLAMQAALQGMQGMSMPPLGGAAPGAAPHQAYNDTMAAIAMQQAAAAAAAAGHQFFPPNPFMMAWQQQAGIVPPPGMPHAAAPQQQQQQVAPQQQQ